MPDLISKIKKLLRLSGDALDDVVKMNVEAALDDIADQGVNIDTQDNLIVKAVELYCKWQMNHNGEADRFEKNYTTLRDTMSKQEAHRQVDGDA
ncbi:MAG: hypothetical protein IKS39_06990 [Clostridia bacterium]|nr:hypothetical protein [Clostridia bacterium]